MNWIIKSHNLLALNDIGFGYYCLPISQVFILKRRHLSDILQHNVCKRQHIFCNAPCAGVSGIPPRRQNRYQHIHEAGAVRVQNPWIQKIWPANRSQRNPYSAGCTAPAFLHLLLPDRRLCSDCIPPRICEALPTGPCFFHDS